MLQRETQHSTLHELTFTSSQERMSTLEHSFDLEIKPLAIPARQSTNENYKLTAQMNLPRQGPTLKTIAAKIQPERLMQNETYSKDIFSG